eukprot:8728180-Alexandrium_andersonii.AAC.1
MVAGGAGDGAMLPPASIPHKGGRKGAQLASPKQTKPALSAAHPKPPGPNRGKGWGTAVSYTHLTLPTICSV